MPFFNTRAGPMVLEIPPASDEGSITGAIDNAWQVPLEDVGPEGVDKGKGGKFLILPPGYKDKAPKGYIALPSETYGGFALLRSILRGGTDADIAKAVAYGKRVKLYPLTQAASPPATVSVNATDVVFDGAIPYDLSYFQSLDRIVQTEPWLERDKAMIDQLKSLGIEKGKPFNPDPKTKEMLESSAREANAWLDARLETLLSRLRTLKRPTGRYRLRLKWSKKWSKACPPASRNPTAIPLMDAASPPPSPSSASSIWRPDSST